MLRYLQDFPLDQWVIAKADAEGAYFRMLERARWRKLGIRIYGPSRMPEVFPNGFLRAGDSMPPQLLLSNGMAANPSMYHPSMRPNGFAPPQLPHQPPPPQQILRSQPNAPQMNGQPHVAHPVSYQPPVQMMQLPTGPFPVVPNEMVPQPSYHPHLGGLMNVPQPIAQVPNVPGPQVAVAQNAQ